MDKYAFQTMIDAIRRHSRSLKWRIMARKEDLEPLSVRKMKIYLMG